MRCFITIFFIIGAQFANAAKVARIVPQQNLFLITHTENIVWKVGDAVCTVRDGREVVCGTLTKVVGRAGMVTVKLKITEAKIGDEVRRSGATTPVAAPAGKRSHVNLSAGLVSGLHYMIPLGGLALAVGDRFSLGLSVGYRLVTDIDTSVTMVPVLFTASYYKRAPFEGIWGQCAVGAHLFSAEAPDISESAKSLTFIGTLGYRHRLKSGLNAGLAVGGEYISLPTFESVTFGFPTLQAVILFDVGFNF